MSSMARVCPLLASTALAIGCFNEPPPSTTSTSIEETGSASDALTPAPELQICPKTHWIGRVAVGDVCPDPKSPGTAWTVTSLFGSNTSPHLRGFCHYSFNGAAATPPPAALAQLPDYDSKPPGQWLGADCAAAAAHGPTEDAQAIVLPTLRNAFHTQLETPGAMSPGAQRVRVAVIDSKPSISDHPGMLRHGLAMGSLIDEVACSRVGGSCNVSIDYALALNLQAPNQPNEVEGGLAGYVHRLATTTVDAVDAWQAEDPLARLVVSYALGVDPTLAERANGTLKPPTQALLGAIRYARCKKALVIAAAGNKTEGPASSETPVYPGKWGDMQAPACAGLGDVPLVYPITGVDHRDIKLRSTRDLGRAELAAPGFQVMSSAMVNGRQLLMKTSGSSPATATASAVAAAVWSQSGSLSADEVMQKLYASGEDLGAVADFCHTSACRSIKRISLCRALNSAGAALHCDRIHAYEGQNPALSAQQLASLDGLLDPELHFDGTALVTPYDSPVCSMPVHVDASEPLPNDEELLCPSEHIYKNNYAPLVEPQPNPDPCGLCFTGLIDLNIYVNPRVSHGYPQSLKLYQTGNAEPVHIMALNTARTTADRELSIGLEGGETARVLLPTGLPPFDSATIDWTIDSATPRAILTSELLVQ